MKKTLKGAAAIVFCLTLSSFTACTKRAQTDYSAFVTERTDFRSVYGEIGKYISVEQVKEREDGTATVEYEGKTYELGMDFLSMAMVYNTQTSEAYKTKDDVYNRWWKLYIERWNSLMPEVPLYSNQYYDLYNAKIQGFSTTPYFSPADAIVSCKVKSGEKNSVVLGSITDLSGLFRNAGYGKSSPSSSDLDIQSLVTGYATAAPNRDGAYEWAGENIVRSHSEEKNADGTLTVTIEIADGLVFSDGSPITAKHYLAPLIGGSTPVYAQASGSASGGISYVGYEAFNAYDGTNEGERAKKEFSGVRLLDENTFSVTIVKDYADYYYSIAYSAFSPAPLKLYLGEFDLKDDGNGCYLEQGYYAKETKNGVEKYALASKITANMNDLNKNSIPYSGPYFVERYDDATKTATLKINPSYKGDYRGKPSIETISYVKIVPQTQLDQFKAGQVDVLSGITGGKDTKAAIALADTDPAYKDKVDYVYYDRAGYGKLAFRCDLGPAQFKEVRRAVAYTLNRTKFANDFTGGYGTVVHGPYYTGMSAYKANEGNLRLNAYEYSAENAVEELEKGGWVYGADGKAYTDGVRYKKLEGYEKTYHNLHYASTDNKYRTVKVGDEFYMPLVLNWYGTQPNEVTDLLITAWKNSETATKAIGAYITYTSAEFVPAVYGDYGQVPAYGFNGTARCTAVNFATGFNSAVYDQSYYWTIDSEKYANYSSNYLMDQADFYGDY